MGWFSDALASQTGGSLAGLGSSMMPGRNSPQPVPGMPPQRLDNGQLPDSSSNGLTPPQVPGMPPNLQPGQPPFNPNVVINDGWGSEGPGGITGHGQDPDYWRITTDQGMPGGEGSNSQSLSDQDYTNTINRMRELQQDDWRYPTPIVGSNPNDPRRNEMNVLQQRLMQGSGSRNWQQELYPNMGQSFNDLMAGNRGNGQVINQPMGLGREMGPMGSLQSLGLNPQSIQRAAMGAGQIGQMINLRGPDGTTKAVPMDQAAHWISKGAVRF